MPRSRRADYPSGLTRSTYLLALSSLFADISTEMLYPVLPIFLTQVLGVGGSVIGLIEGVATATQYIVQGLSGWLSDKVQRHKSIALFGYLLAALSKPLIGLSVSWQGVLGARFLDRWGSGTRSAPRDALVAGSVPEAQRGQAFGLEGIGDNLGAFLGPLLAIALLFYYKVPIRSIFYLAIIPGLLAVVMVLLVSEKSSVIRSKAKLDLALNRFPTQYWQYLGVTTLFGLGNFSSAFLILQTRAQGVSVENTILIYAFFNLAAALISYPSGALSDLFGRKRLLGLGFLCLVLTFLGFAVSGNIWILAGLFILYGFFQGIFRAVGKALASDYVPQARRASAIGWYSATIGLSGLIASLTAGQLWDKIGHPSVFLYGAAFGLAGVLALWLLPMPVRGAN